MVLSHRPPAAQFEQTTIFAEPECEVYVFYVLQPCLHARGAQQAKKCWSVMRHSEATSHSLHFSRQHEGKAAIRSHLLHNMKLGWVLWK